MKKFIKNHKNLSIAIGIVILLFLVSFIVIFVAPLFKTNNYGDRLDDIEKYKVTNNMINSVKEATLENDGVADVSYHKEGRILNFIITLDGEKDLETVKAYANDITDNLSSKIKKYYDIEDFINTKSKSSIYPVIGYHSKGGKEFTWSNVGENSE